MNKSDFIVIDFETGSADPYKTQPIEVAMLAINARKLEIIEGSQFVSLMKPFDDETAIKLGLDPIQDEALEINKKTREQLEKAPDPKLVWKRVEEHVNRYNPTKKKWDAPVPVGYNSDGFDAYIWHRLCCLDPYKYGPIDLERKRNKLFHPIHSVDVMKYVFAWTENNFDMFSISLDTVRDWMGISKVGAHEALKDVIDTANIFIKFMKLHRNYATKVKFANAFGGNNVGTDLPV